MADLLQTSLSALLTSQRALATTGHNIANVNTPGYSRQRVELGTRVPDIASNGVIGNGVQLQNITRSYDAYLATELRGNQSGFNRLDTFHTMAMRIDGLLADESSGVAPSLQQFFSAAQDVANNPSSLPARQAMLAQADGIADRFQSLANQFEGLEREASNRLRQEVGTIDALAQSIADANQEIIAVQGQIGGASPNDLLDHRDRLINELSTKIDVTTTTQEDGAVNIFIGSGQALVIGTNASQVSVESNPFDSTRLDVLLTNGSSTNDISSSVSGGVAGGIMDFRREVLDPARNEIGRIAIAFASSVNAQQAVGMDLNGDLGGDFFSIGDPKVVEDRSNSGTGAVTASITDLGQLTAADYALTYSGGSYQLSRNDTGEAVSMTGSGTAGDPFVADGVSFTTSGAPAEGDKFLIRPTYDAAASLQNVLGSAQEIAAASPVRSSADLSNLGSGTISSAQVFDPENPALLNDAQIEFTSPTTFSVNGAGSFAYTEGEPIEINGTSVTIEGSPETGDTFMLQANTDGSGDNSNILAMASLQTADVLDNGTSSMSDAVGQLVTQIGTTTSLASINLTAQSAVLEQSINQQESVSGVNLDEEAANMLRYQQAYEAAAQMITVADSLFSTVLNAVRR